MRRLLGSFVLAACILQVQATEPWPLPPDSYFLERLPKPPAPDSRDDLADRNASIALQKNAAPDEIAHAEAFSKFDVFDFATVVGPNFTPVNFPRTAAFFARLQATADRPKNFIKDHYARPRPYLGHPEAIKQLVTPDTGYSYPSGHGTRSWLYARVLGELDPGHLEQFLKRANAIGQSRVLGGMHYLSDIAASHKLADLLFTSLMSEPEFRSQLETLRLQEWNSARSALPRSRVDDETRYQRRQLIDLPHLEGFAPIRGSLDNSDIYQIISRAISNFDRSSEVQRISGPNLF